MSLGGVRTLLYSKTDKTEVILSHDSSQRGFILLSVYEGRNIMFSLRFASKSDATYFAFMNNLGITKDNAK